MIHLRLVPQTKDIMQILFSVLFFLVSFFTVNGFSEIEDQGGWNKWGLRARAPPLFEEGFKKAPYYYLTYSATPEDEDQSKGTKFSVYFIL